jgi:arylsulfatase A-like enzyme
LGDGREKLPVQKLFVAGEHPGTADRFALQELANLKAFHAQPVSLIDIYPTLIDLCRLTRQTRKNDKGHSLDGHSLKPLLEDPESGEWSGPDSVLTALYKWRMKYDPSQESYALRAKDWRYIRYENGKEELYFTKEDPYEWTNLANDSAHVQTLGHFRQQN